MQRGRWHLPAFQLRSEPANLLDVMQTMHEVKLPPLRDGKRAKQGMVEDLGAMAKLRGTAREHSIHVVELDANLGGDFLRREAAGTRNFRSFAA